MAADLWDFATRLYARPGVEAAGLYLQSRGADVCLLLTGLWLDRRGTPCNAEHCAQLRQIAAPWQEDVVEPLRQLRQSWRAAAQQDKELAQLREQLKRLELEAERMQLQRLEVLASSWAAYPGNRQRDWLDALVPGASAPEREARDRLHGACLEMAT
ncbi:TIGR02444 family protein [Phytopseudomonas dryadis]|uniref:TIGR02444 family protein n=1 Tax=Phytopseudomonas dryadis TaxID=2487520 RepID=A0ABY1Z6F4_9GAMM|nr:MULTISPECIES: TIGR02444 family protein [Pseudomonas]TBV06423.1 TIGR02444 family protein [Pseudomonas dryadis]TBV17890.1 TIGR02444 family protein [Pseudomonas sp. FRB 230]